MMYTLAYIRPQVKEKHRGKMMNAATGTIEIKSKPLPASNDSVGFVGLVIISIVFALLIWG